MKKLSYFMGLWIVFFGFSVQADSFIEGMEDVPVAPNFVQAQADSVSFGGVDSHFLEAVLVSEDESSKDSYRAYYKETMPQFGWTLAEEKELKLKGQNGRKLVEEKYSCNKIAQEFIEMYKKVL